MISWPYHYHARDSVSHGVSQPVCTITAVSKTLFGGRLVLYDLSLAPYRTNWVSFSRLRHDPRKLLDHCGRPSMFVLRSMRKHPEIFGGRFGNHSKPSGKAIDNTQDEQSSKLLRVPFAGLQLSGGRNWLRSSPAQKDDSTCARVLCSRAVSVAIRLSCGTGRPGRADVARQAFRRSSYYLCASATAPAISGALSTRPQRRRRRWPDSKKTTTWWRPAGWVPCRRPRCCGCLRDGRQRGVVHSRERDRGSGTACHTGASMGCGSVLPRVAPL